MWSGSGRTSAGRRACAWAVFLCCALQLGCIHLDVERSTRTSGTFESTGWGLTLLGWDIPKSALDVARENASDARLSNVQVTHTRVIPYLGWFDWLLDIVGVRWAKVSGTWGYAGAE